MIKDLKESCLLHPKRVGFADGLDERVVLASCRLLDEKSVSEVVVYGQDDPEGAKYRALLDAVLTHNNFNRPVRGLKYKSLSKGQSALEVAAADLAGGQLDCVLAGNQSTTASVIRAGIRGVGLAAGIRTVSGVFVMESPLGHISFYADCGVVIAPTVEQLCDIAMATVATCELIFPDIQPVVAFLSFSTKGSATHEIQQNTADAAGLFAIKRPDIRSDGELQFDAASVPKIAAIKCPESPVRGQANCFIFPNLNAGNIAYKMAQRLAGYGAYGPILQGLAKPFSDLSRGASVDDIMTCTYINLLRARSVP